MRWTEALQGVRVAVFLNILHRWESAELNQAEAADLLGVSERTFRRWRDRYDEEGDAGLIDGRLGKASGRRVPVDRAEEVEALYRERYQGFTVKHFHEHLVKDHGFGWGYSWTKLHLQWKGLVAKAPRKGAHRRRRERRPLPGMMLHQDGSRHAWLEGQPALDLIVTLDDATGAIDSAFLVEEEGTASTFRALKDVFGTHGLPMSLYTDRGAHYFYSPGRGDRPQAADPGRPGAGAARRRAYRGLFAASQRSIRAGVPDPAGPAGQGAFAGADHVDRASQRLHPRGLSARPQRALRRAAGSARFGLHPDPRRRSRRDPLRAGGTPGHERQLRFLSQAEIANPAKPDARPFRQGAGQGARLSRRLLRPLPWAPMHRPLRPEWSDQRDEKRRLNPLGGAPVEMWTRHPPCPQSHRRTEPEEADI
jgi:transposase